MVLCCTYCTHKMTRCDSMTRYKKYFHLLIQIIFIGPEMPHDTVTHSAILVQCQLVYLFTFSHFIHLIHYEYCSLLVVYEQSLYSLYTLYLYSESRVRVDYSTILFQTSMLMCQYSCIHAVTYGIIREYEYNIPTMTIQVQSDILPQYLIS